MYTWAIRTFLCCIDPLLKCSISILRLKSKTFDKVIDVILKIWDGSLFPFKGICDYVPVCRDSSLENSYTVKHGKNDCISSWMIYVCG